MKIEEIGFVCYAATSLKKSQAFYEGILGLKPTSTWVQNDTMGMIEYDIGPGTLSIGAGADNFKPGRNGGATVALEVDDIDSWVKHLKAKKVKFLMEKMDSPVCFMALVEDPAGNGIMLHQRKKK